jgi:hypothetical protein
MEIFRHVLQWALPSAVLLLIFLGAYQESKENRGFAPDNGPASGLSALAILIGIGVGLVNLLTWVY